MSSSFTNQIEITGRLTEEFSEILTQGALAFVESLHPEFSNSLTTLLEKRKQRQPEIDAGQMPDCLPETKHIREEISASSFDFGLYIFHNAKRLIENGTGPYFYLPELENYIEARLWNNVFCMVQDMLGIPNGTLRVTVLPDW